ncbi:MAG: prepilin peptidase [Actinomycetes bacterium]
MWPALSVVALVSLWLAAIDMKTMRIPNRIVLPATALAALLAFIGGFEVGLKSIFSALVAYLLFVVLNLLSRGQVGMGDAKLGALLGAGLGLFGWDTLMLGVSLGFVFGGIAALFKLIAARGKNLRASFAYGPYLVAGALVVIVASVVAS